MERAVGEYRWIRRGTSMESSRWKSIVAAWKAKIQKPKLALYSWYEAAGQDVLARTGPKAGLGPQHKITIFRTDAVTRL
jgi:hypothetical protein